MTDVLTPDQRKYCMSKIRSKDTEPELIVRKGLFARGFRFRLHYKSLPGKPDLVFPKYNAVIFVNGCFWHGHKCHLFKQPQSNSKFWLNKISKNRKNDSKAKKALLKNNWRVMIIWECAIKGKKRIPKDRFFDKTERWLLSNKKLVEIKNNS